MSENQRASSSMKDSFFQLFSYDSKALPIGASLDELLKSCPYTESAPTKFSVCYSSLKELSLFSLYSSFISFTQKHSKIDAIQECIFPLFCHIVMYFRINEEPDKLNDFISKYLITVPQKFREEVDDFLLFDQSKTYHHLSCLLSTQLYIIKCTYDEYEILNNFLNEPINFQLKRYITDIITIEILRHEVVDKLPTIIFKNKSATSNLNILNIKMKEASFASILSDLSSIFISVYDTQICQIDTCKRQYQQLYSHSSVVTSMSISSTSKLLLTTDINGDAIIYDNYSKSDNINSKLNRIECITPIWCSTFAPQGGVFALGTHDKLIRLYDPTTLENFRAMVGHTEPVKTVLFHPNCSLLGSLSCDASFRIWDIRQAETNRIFIGKPQRNNALSFAPNGRIAAFFDGGLEICDIGSGKVFRKDMHDIKNAEFTCFSDDSSYLYIVCSDGKIVSVDLSDGNYKYSDGNFKYNDVCRLEANVLSCRFLKSGDLVVATAAKTMNSNENSEIEGNEA